MIHKIGFWGLIAAYCLWVISPVINHDYQPMLIENMPNVRELPRHFRLSTDPLRETAAKMPSSAGLSTLNISGSAQFSEESLSAILDKIPSKKIIVVDLREESHGFLNGMAVSWYTSKDWSNVGKSLSQIEADEDIRLIDAKNQGWKFVYKKKFIPLLIYVRESQTEKDLAKQRSLGYFRLPVTDHKRPTDHDVDTFIEFVKVLPEDTWLHFHCAAGIGRTTTFMVMYDMMRNHQVASAEDIIKRQALLGGIDLLAPLEEVDWRYPYKLEREQFAATFYLYCQENPHFEKTWSEWVK